MGSEPDGFEEDSSNLSGSSGSGDSRCPICDEPTKMHKTYHLATKHFRDRLLKELPGEKPFKCPECEHESKTKINMWTHYLGKHRYGAKWMAEILDQKQKGKEMAPPIKPAQTSFEPSNFRQFGAQQITPPAPPQPYQQSHYISQQQPQQAYHQSYSSPYNQQPQQHQILPSPNLATPPHPQMTSSPNFNPTGYIQSPIQGMNNQLNNIPQHQQPPNIAMQQPLR